MSRRPIRIAPSILSADFAKLGEEVAALDQAGADYIHIDVMDGHFVPNLSMGPAIVASLRRVTRLPLEVHLMVEQPERFIDGFLNSGADSLIAHLEVLPDPRPFADRLRARGKKVGLAINPPTAISTGATTISASLPSRFQASRCNRSGVQCGSGVTAVP